MGFLTPFTSPRDPRWQGFQRHHHIFFLIKNLLLIPFIILLIVEYALLRRWWVEECYSYCYEMDEGPYQFWLRIGMALVPELLYTIATLVLIFQTPHLSRKGRTWTFHPAVALSFSLAMFGLYVGVTFVNAILIYGNEYSFHNSYVWYQIGYAEVGFQGVFGLCYVGMIVCSCVAVHRWRMAEIVSRKEGKDGFLEMGNEEVAKERDTV